MKRANLFILTLMMLCQVDLAAAAVLEDMVVTATRTETAMEKIGGNSVTVITAADIKARNIDTIKDALGTVPGLHVASSGGLGTQTTVFMRGADSKNTLVLMDGIMLNDPSEGSRGCDLGSINLDNVERIEVVRGALSVMYGSNATAGVINIITKKGKGKPVVGLKLEGGSYGTWKTLGTLSGETGKLNYALSASRLESEGFSTANKDNGDIPQAGNTDEKDGYDNTTLSANLGYRLTDNFTVSAVARFLDADVDMDEAAGGYTGDGFSSTYPEIVPDPQGPTEKHTESEKRFAKVSINNSFFDKRFDSTLSYQFAGHERMDYKNDGSWDFDFKSDSDELSWQGSLHFLSNTLSLGTLLYNESMESKSQYSTIEKCDTTTQSYWLQDQFFAGDNMVIVAGVRLDDHDAFGNKTTYRLAPSYTIPTTGTTLKASYGTGFRAPSLYELYSSYGNKTLDPEESKGWDMGIEQSFMEDRFRCGVTYFNMAYDNRIGFDMVTWTYTQVEGKTKTSGAEAFAAYSPLSALDFMLNYTYTDTKEPDGARLARRPYNKAALTTRYRFLGKGLVNLDILWVDDRKASAYAMDKDGHPVDILDAYTLVNLSASYEITPNVKLYSRIDNLFDTFYEESFANATPGLSGYVGVQLTY
ncbi:MAG: TonB-dependent receptor [Desulfobacterium sp.]|nr:TonB-dependent receptor [Desulfobacterium sp.]